MTPPYIITANQLLDNFEYRAGAVVSSSDTVGTAVGSGYYLGLTREIGDTPVTELHILARSRKSVGVIHYTVLLRIGRDVNVI